MRQDVIARQVGGSRPGIGNLANLQHAAAAPAVVLCVVPVSTPAEARQSRIRSSRNIVRRIYLSEAAPFTGALLPRKLGLNAGLAVRHFKTSFGCDGTSAVTPEGPQ
jgi:hypothetical protein